VRKAFEARQALMREELAEFKSRLDKLSYILEDASEPRARSLIGAWTSCSIQTYVGTRAPNRNRQHPFNGPVRESPAPSTGLWSPWGVLRGTGITIAERQPLYVLENQAGTPLLYATHSSRRLASQIHRSNDLDLRRARFSNKDLQMGVRGHASSATPAIVIGFRTAEHPLPSNASTNAHSTRASSARNGSSDHGACEGDEPRHVLAEVTQRERRRRALREVRLGEALEAVVAERVFDRREVVAQHVDVTEPELLAVDVDLLDGREPFVAARDTLGVGDQVRDCPSRTTHAGAHRRAPLASRRGSPSLGLCRRYGACGAADKRLRSTRTSARFVRAFAASAASTSPLRDVVVPLHERRDRSASRDRATIELPDLVLDVIGVRVEDVPALVGVTGEVHLHDTLGGHRVDVRHGSKPWFLADT